MERLIKGKRNKFLIIVVTVFLFVIFATLVLPAMFFPLRLDVSGHVFHVGDTISGTVTFTNKSGQEVTIISHVGDSALSNTHIFNIKNMGATYFQTLIGHCVIMKAGDTEVRDFRYEFTEAGIYVVRAYSSVEVNNYPIWNARYSIAIVG